MKQSYVPFGSQIIGGNVWVRNGRGGLDPIERIADQDLLRDQLVSDLFDAAVVLSKKLRAFKAQAYADVQAHLDLVDEQYGANNRPGGDKGNVTLSTIDCLKRVTIQVADVIRFESAPLQSAKKLVDECLAEWSADANADMRAILVNAFRVNKAGEMNRSALLDCLRLEFRDPRLVRAMEAVRDAIQIDGTKTYIRVHHRPTPDSRFEGVALDAASA